MKLEMQNIYKSFGINTVLKGVNITIESGDIFALLGENGAGKSTLMNILGGVLPTDTGKILLDEKEIHFHNPSEAIEAGIGFIHQELNLINDLAIYENMFIGKEIKKNNGFLDQDTMIGRTQEIFNTMGLSLDPRTMVRDLDASYKQFVEIARALMMKASLIIMDEPTSSLTITEIERVFAMMKVLRNQGVSMIFISHKLGEVMEICTRYMVLRDGNMIASGKIKDTTTKALAQHMVGHDINTKNLSIADVQEEEILRLENLSNARHFHNINLSVKKGEVLGVTGLLGDGRSELFQTVFGALPHYTGNIVLDGRIIKINSPAIANKLGIAYVPRNRKENGIVKDMSILENGTLVAMQDLQKHGFIDKNKQESLFREQKNNLHIKMNQNNDLITSLSGGNQQKVVLAKWLCSNPKILILDNPTQGVDIGAKEEIYDIILKLAQQGVALIVLSSEAQEVIRVCHRTIVMYHGCIVGEVFGDEMNEPNIMHIATGGNAIKESR